MSEVPPISDVELEAIRKGLAGVTPGPWQASGLPYDGLDDPIITGADDQYVCQTVYDMQSGTQKHDVNADTAHIVRLDPNTVRAILARIDAAEEVMKAIVEQAEGAAFDAWLEDLGENPPRPTEALRRLMGKYNEAVRTGALKTDFE